MMTDLRLALRTLAAAPVVTVAIVASLALGTGANTAMFSIVNGLLLRELPVHRPDRLVLLLSNPSVTPSSPWSNPVWERIRDHHAGLFEDIFAFSRRTVRFNLAASGETEFVDGVYASGRYFDGLGVQPLLGRAFTAADDRRGGGPEGPVAVISHTLWQSRFGGRSEVIGQKQTIDRVPFTIIGVMPPQFAGTDIGSRFDVILPIGTEPLLRGSETQLDRASTSSLLVMARLKDGQTIPAAEQALRRVQPHIREATMPANASQPTRARHLAVPFGVEAATRGTSALRTRFRQPVLILLGAVALVLVIACANVTNLFLARAAERRHEFSVRLALGASRWRLARLPLLEAVLLATTGSVLGMAVARWTSTMVVHQLSTHTTTVFLDTQPDWRVFAFTMAVAVAVAVLFGLAPAFYAARTQPIESIRAQGRHTSGERRARVGSVLVVGQVALSFVLVVAAGLFVRTFTALATLNVGFDRERVLLVRLDFPARVAPERRISIYEDLVAAVRDLPGVAHAAISEITPVSGLITDDYVEVENGPTLEPPQNVTYRNVITAGWFATYGTPLVAGRDFDGRDRPESPPVAIVNQTFVRRFLPGANPIGRRIRNPSSVPGEERPWIEVVGVVGDATYLSLRSAVPPTMYVPLAQRSGSASFPFATMSVRAASGSPAALIRSVTTTISRVHADVAVTFTPLTQQLAAALVQERTIAILSGGFSLLALALAALGLYGVTAHAVNRRRAEIAIRMAVGAAPARVVRLVLARVVTLVAIGIVIGAGTSLWASQFVASLLYDLAPTDPWTLVTSSVVLASVGVLAGWLPASRAARLDPAASLREGPLVSRN